MQCMNKLPVLWSFLECPFLFDGSAQGDCYAVRNWSKFPQRSQTLQCYSSVLKHQPNRFCILHLGPIRGVINQTQLGKCISHSAADLVVTKRELKTSPCSSTSKHLVFLLLSCIWQCVCADRPSHSWTGTHVSVVLMLHISLRPAQQLSSSGHKQPRHIFS